MADRDSTDASELLTIAEAARELKVTPRTIRNYIASGRLEAIEYSRKVKRIRRADLAPNDAPDSKATAA